MNKSTEIRYITIKLPSPFTALMAGILFVAIIIFLSPVKLLYIGSIYSWLYIEFSIASIFLGLLIGSKKVFFKSYPILITINSRYAKNIFFLIIMLSSVGVILRIYDKYFIRGASFANSMIENREVLMDAGTNIFSIVSSILYPLVLFIPFFYLFLRRIGVSKAIYFIITLVLASFPIVDGLFFGSRSLIMILLLLIIFYLYVLGYIKFKLNTKNIFFLFIFLVGFFLFNGYIFDARTRLIGLDPIDSTQVSVYAYFLPLTDSTQIWLDGTKGSIFYFFALGIINFMQYISHGFFELLYLVDKFDTSNIYYGKQQFAVILKFIYKLLHIPFSFETNQEGLVRTGIYNTLFGPIYYDFGFVGVLFSFIIGFIIGKISNIILIKRNFILFPIYLYMILIIYFSLVVNLITFAQGLYSFVSFVLFFIFSSFFKKPKWSIELE